MCTLSSITEPSTLALAIATLAILITTFTTMGLFSSPKFNPKGKFCYIPGGSAGLGKALAEELVRRGAHVVIVARGAARAAETVSGLKKIAGDDNERKIFAVSADLSSHEESERALNDACAAFGGRAPDYTFLSAGFTIPKLFISATPEELKHNIDGVYWTAAWTAHAVAKLLVKQRVEGASITFVSSFLGYAAVPGYTPYTPGKFAVRGLADSLRAELKLYDIAVHLYMPAGILSPGYEDEQKIKHALTKKIEESDTPISAELCTKYLLKGIERGQYQITNDLLTDIVRVSTCGPVPWNGPMDVVYGFFGLFAMPIYRFVVESTTKKFKKSIEEEHKADGFYDN